MTDEKFIKPTGAAMVDINNTARAELSNNLRELTCGQQQQWHDSIWPRLSESHPDGGGRLSVSGVTAEGGGRGDRGVQGIWDNSVEGKLYCHTNRRLFCRR